MAKYPIVKPGQAIGGLMPNGDLLLNASMAKLLNEAAAELKRLGSVSVAAPLRWTEEDKGRIFACDLPPVILAKLSGSGNPYAFVEQKYDKATNTFSDRPAGRTGTTAYESTGKAGLGGKVVLLGYEGVSNDWRFHYVGSRPACGWRIVTLGCNNSPLPGATVEIRQNGELIDSCISDYEDTIQSVKWVSGGSGYTNGSYTNGTFSGGGGSGGTFNYTVFGGVIQSGITLTQGGSGYTSAPTPVFNAGGGSGASAIAIRRASCRMTPPTGVYDITVSGPSGQGYASKTTPSQGFFCFSSSDVVSTPSALGPDSDHVCVSVCNNPIPKVLYVTDGLGQHTLTWGTSGWGVVETISDGVWKLVPFVGCTSGGTMNVTYFLDTGFGLTIGWRVSCCGSPNPDYVYADNSNQGAPQPGSTTMPIGAAWTKVSITSCSPLSAVSTVPATGTVGYVDQAFCGSGNESTYAGFNTPGGGGAIAVSE